MRIQVSNDDGVEASGMRALAEALLELGEVSVCAPDREQSATSRSISLHRPLRIEQLPGPDGQIERCSVDGTPTDAVYIGLNQVLKGRAPDLVASGINRGPNLANDVHYSGTVAAAMEGCVGGFPSFAISLVKGRDYAHAARFAAALARQIGLHGLPPGTLLNVNVPGGVPEGAQITRIGRRSYLAAVVEKLDPRGRAYYWIGGDEQAHEHVPESDCDAVFDRRLISVTPLHLDPTAQELVEELKR
jgi:5'-nucleotidase